MKKLITVMVIVCSTLSLFAQNETKNENSTNSKGVEPLPLEIPWTFDGRNIYSNSNASKIGIGTNRPQKTLHVQGEGYFSSYVGIKTTTPSSELEVNGDIAIKGDNTAFGKGKLLFNNNGNTTKFYQKTDGLYIIANDNVDSPVIIEPDGKLTVDGNLTSGSFNTGSIKTTSIELLMPFSTNKFNLTLTSEGLEFIPSENPAKKTIFKSNGDVEFSGNIIGVESSQWSQEIGSSRLYYSDGDVAVGTERLARMNNGKFNIFHESDVEAINWGESGTQHGLFILGDDPTSANDQVLGMGVDSDSEVAYIQSYKMWNTCKKLALNPKGGAVEVGGESTPNSNLHVHGKVWAKEIEVVENVPTADYVFEADYKLRSIEEVEQFVKTNKHLPDVPSAVEFKANGYKVGDMDNMLLQKVEELTLYIIAQEKRIQKLEEENNKLKGE